MARRDGGGPARLRPPAVVLAVALVGALGLAGCGGGEGVAGGATVRVYASAPLSGAEAAAGRAYCAAARAVLRRAGGGAGDVHVRLVCLDAAAGGRRWSLASVGANARRASEDSATVAYLGEPRRAAARFSRPILEAAGIGQAGGASGAAAMTATLRSLREADGAGRLRQAVAKRLETGQ